MGIRMRDGFEKYQEVESMDGIVTFGYRAEKSRRKVTYCRNDNSLILTAS